MNKLEIRVAALETQVQRLSDELEIRRILSRYGPLVDIADNDERLRKAAEFFGQDGYYDLGPGQVFNGPDFASQCLAVSPHQDYVESGSTHVMAMPYVVVDQDCATALGYSHVFRRMENGAYEVIRASANYWEFEREGGRWKLVRRTNRLMDGSVDSKALLHHVDDSAVTARKAD